MAGAGRVQAHDRHVDALERGLLVGEVPAGLDRPADSGVHALDRVRNRYERPYGAAGSVDLILAGGAGCGRFTVRPSGTGAPGVKQGGQAGLVRWAESPC